MDNLQTLLKGRLPEEPAEIQIIKRYAQDEFQSAVTVLVRDKDIIITAPGAALINTLRLRGPEIRRLCRTDKRLIFRIG